MVDPTKKNAQYLRAKEKPQQDDRRGEITFRIKPHSHQRPHRDRANPAFGCLSVSCGVTGQQWPAAGTGPLTAADLGGTAGSVKSSWRRSPLAPP